MLPNTIELITDAGAGRWTDVARGNESVDLASALTLAGHSLPLQPTLVRAGGREYVALAKRLRESQQSAPVAVVLGYSLDDALQPYRSVALAWASPVALGLAAGLIGAMLIARSVAHPIETLAATVHRIESGDYTAPSPVSGGGEIGQLAAAFTNMTHAIAEREERIRHQALHDAVTGLPNRQAAEAAIREALTGAANTSGALLMVGLARLPEIIQTMGDSICDRVMHDAGARPAIRLDVFSTEQLPQSIENRVREHGNAITFALNWRPRDWLRVTGEALHVYSWRNQRIEEGIASAQNDNQLPELQLIVVSSARDCSSSAQNANVVVDP